MNSGNLLAEILKTHGIRYVFGIPGGQTQPFYDAIPQSDLMHILVRDERSAPYAADAYARVTGHMAVCDAVPGPGVIKFPSGLAEALCSSSPLLAVAGDLPQAFMRYARYGCAAQGIGDQTTALEPLTKALFRVRTQGDLPRMATTAIKQATAGRPGPVVINIPADIMHLTWDPATLALDEAFAEDADGSAFRPASPDMAKVDVAARTLEQARRPILVAGGGVLGSGAWIEVEALAETLDMAVVTTISGKGAMREDHPLYGGVMGSQYGEPCANVLVDEADVVFLVGFKSSQQSTNGWRRPRPDQTVIHLDIDPDEIGKVFQTTVGLVGDARAGLQLLCRRVPVTPNPAWRLRVKTLRQAWDEEVRAEMVCESELIWPQHVMREVARSLALEDIVISDASFSIGWVASYLDAHRAGRSFLFPRGSATLGFGLPAAIGAALGRPDARVFCVVGDGGIAYSVAELSTFVKYSLPVTVVVLNNQGLGYSRWGERRGHQQYENVDFPPADFRQIAQGFGLPSSRVETGAALAEAMQAMCVTDGPSLVEVMVDPWATPELTLRREWQEFRS